MLHAEADHAPKAFPAAAFIQVHNKRYHPALGKAHPQYAQLRIRTVFLAKSAIPIAAYGHHHPVGHELVHDGVVVHRKMARGSSWRRLKQQPERKLVKPSCKILRSVGNALAKNAPCPRLAVVACYAQVLVQVGIQPCVLSLEQRAHIRV